MSNSVFLSLWACMAVTAAELLVLVRAEGVEATAASLLGLGEATSAAALGFGALAIAGAATIGALGASAAAAASFQTTMQNVQNNTTMRIAQVGAMREAVLQLGSETGAPLEQLIGGFTHAMNITGDLSASMDILKIATESAVSTGGKASDTTNILANAMHEYGADVSHAATEQERHNEILANATRYMGIFHLAAAEGNMNLEDFANSSGKSVAAAANLHVPVEQVAAAFSALTRHGFDAATANTQLSNILFHMAAPSKAATKELTALSAASGVDLVSDFSAAGLASKGLDGIMTDLQAAFAKTGRSTQDQSALLATLDGSLESTKQKYLDQGMSEAKATEEAMKLINAQRGGLGLAVLMGTANTDYKNTLRDMTDQQLLSTVTQDAFNRSAQTAGFQFARLKVNMQELSIALGAALLPGLAQILTAVNLIIPALIKFTEAHARVIAAVMAAAGSFAVLVAAHAMLAPSIALVGEAIAAVAAALTGPFALALLAGGLLVRAYATNWHGFGTAVNGAVDVTKAALVGLVAAFKTGDFNAAFGTIITAVDAAFGAGAAGKVTLFVSNALRGLQLFRDTIITVQEALRGEWVSAATIQPFVRAIGEAATEVRAFGLAIRELAMVAASTVGALVAAFRGGDFNAAFGTIITAVDNAFGAGAAGKVTQFVSTALRGLQLLRDTVITVTEALRGDWVPSSAIQPFVNAVGIAATKARELAEAARTLLAPALAFLHEHFLAISTVVGVAISALLGMPLALLAVWTGVKLLAVAWAEDFHGIREITATVVAAIGGTFATLGTTVRGALDDVGTRLSTFGTLVHDTLGNTVTVAVSAVGATFSTLGTTVSGALSVVGGAFSAFGTAVHTNTSDLRDLATTIGAGLHGALTALAGILGTVRAAFGATSGSATAIGAAFQAIGTAASTMRAALVEVTSALANVVRQGVGGYFALLGAAIQPLLPLLGQLAQYLGGALVVAIGVVMGAIGGLAGFLINALAGALRVVTGTIEIISGGIQIFSATLTGVINVVTDLIHGNWTAAWHDAGTALSKAFDGMKMQVLGLVDVLLGSFQVMFGSIIGAIGGFGATVVGYFADVYQKTTGLTLPWAAGMIQNFQNLSTSAITNTQAMHDKIAQLLDLSPTAAGVEQTTSRMGSSVAGMNGPFLTAASGVNALGAAVSGYQEKGAGFNNTLSGLGSAALSLASSMNTGAAAASNYDKALQGIGTKGGELRGYLSTLQTQWDTLNVATDNGAHVTAAQQAAYERLAPALDYVNGAIGANTDQAVSATIAATNHSAAVDGVVLATDKQGQVAATTAAAADKLATSTAATATASATATTAINENAAAITTAASATDKAATATAAVAPAASTATAAVAANTVALADQGAKIAVASVGQAVIQQAFETTGAKAKTTTTDIDALATALGKVPTTLTVTVTTPGAAEAPAAINAITAAVATVPKSFTVTAIVNTSGALAAIADLDAHMPHSPAKKGPFSTLPNWQALFSTLAPAFDGAVAAFQTFGTDAAKKVADTMTVMSKAITDTLGALNSLAGFDVSKNSPTGGQFAMLGTLTAQMVQTIQDAAKGFSDAGLKAATTFADAAGKVGGMVKNALAGLSDLANFDFTKNTPTGSAMGLFRQLVTDMVTNIQQAATAFSDEGIKAASAFSDAATKVMGLIVAGAGAFEKLSSFVAPPAAAIYAFGKTLRAAMNDLALVAEQVTQDAAASAATFAESAGKVVGMLGTGVAAFEKLTTFQAVPLAAVYAFGKALRATINDFALLAEQITPDATKAAALFAEGAGKVVGIIGAGVDGFSKLADFTAPASSAIYAFGKTIRAVINDLALVAEQVTQQATDSAAKFATGATTVLGVFGNGIAGLMDLAKFVAPSQKAIDDFAYAVGHLVERFANAAQMIGEQGVAEAGKFGTAAKLAVDTISVGLTAFKAFKDMVIPSAEAIDTLVAGVAYVVAKFRDMADQMGGEALHKAEAFGTAVENTAKSLQTAIGTFKSLTEKPFKGAMTAIMTEFDADFDGSLNLMRDAVGKAAEYEAQANAYRDDMLRAASAIAAGNAALATAALPGNSLGKDMTKAGANLGDALAQGVRDTLGIKSPSQVMATIGTQVVAGLIQGMSATTPAAVAAAADAASKVAAAISATFDAMTKIGNFREASLSGLYALGKALRAAVNDFAMIAEQVTPELAAAAGLFADGAGKVVATIGTGVDALTKLATYVDPPVAAIYAFGKTIRLIVNDIALVAEQVTVEAAAQAGLFADGAGKVVAILANAVTGFAALSTFQDVAQGTIDTFSRTVGLLVRGIATAAQGLTTDGLDLAGKFADAGGKIVGIMGNAVTGIAALATFTAPAQTTMDAFLGTIRYVIARFAAMAATMSTDGIAATGAFGDAAGKALAAVKTGIDAFAILDATNMPTPAKLDDLVRAVKDTVDRVAVAAATIGGPALANATAFGTAASGIFAALKAGLDLFVQIDKPGNWPTTDWLEPLIELMASVLARSGALVSMAQALKSDADLFAATIGAAFKGFTGAGVGLGTLAGGGVIATTPAATMGVPNGGGGGGGNTYIAVTVSGNTVLGDDYATGAKLAAIIAPELRRLVGV